MSTVAGARSDGKQRYIPLLGPVLICSLSQGPLYSYDTPNWETTQLT